MTPEQESVLRLAIEWQRARGTSTYYIDTCVALDAAVTRMQSAPEPRTISGSEHELWEALGKWSIELVRGGEHAELAPPQYLLDAVRNMARPEVAAKPVAWALKAVVYHDCYFDHAKAEAALANWRGLYPNIEKTIVPLYTAPLVAEREVLRELVDAIDGYLTGGAGPAWDDLVDKIVAARALLRNTPEPVVCPPREPGWRERAKEEPSTDREMCLVWPTWYGDKATLMEWCAKDRVFLLEYEDGDRVTHWMPVAPLYDAFKDEAAKERPNAAAHESAEIAIQLLDPKTSDVLYIYADGTVIGDTRGYTCISNRVPYLLRLAK